MALNYPSLLPGVFADDAADHATIPDTGADEGRMAWDVGFPSETSQPIAAGGVPPRRLDMNGLGNRLSQHVFWQQSGGLYQWDATLDYPPYAHVIGSDGKEYIASAPSGPSQGSGPVNPTTDDDCIKWKSFPRTLVDIIYPVGSIYMSVLGVSPATLFGGTWTPIQGKFLLASSTEIPNGTSSGLATHTLSAAELPAHTHDVIVQNSVGHTHTATTANAGTHSHTITVISNGAHTHNLSGDCATAGAHQHAISISNGAVAVAGHTHSVTVAAKSVSANTGTAGAAHVHTVIFPKTTLEDATSSNGSHNHDRGTMNITGTFDADDLDNDSTTPSVTGAFGYQKSTTRRDSQNGSHNGYAITFNARDGWTGSTSSAGAHKHNVTIAKTTMTSGNADTGHAHSISITVPAQSPTTTVAGAHSHNVSGNTQSVAAHKHSLSGGTAVSAGSHTHTASNADNGSHNHTVTVQTGGVHTHNVTVGTTGGNAAFSVMPPYLSVNVWKRTA